MRARLTLASYICCTAVAVTLNGLSHAQTWETAANHVGDDRYFLPPYPVVFVAARVNEIPSSGGIDGYYHIGADVLSANNPDRGHHLWIVMPRGAVQKLFPLPVHQQIAGLIDTPLGQLDRASIVEPNVSEDGTKIYFSYFHDTTLEASSSFGLHRLPLKGADLYVLDLTDLLADPSVDPAVLPVTRLTFRTYAGNGAQAPADRIEQAMNQTLANGTGPNDWGTVYMHAVEMRTASGLKLVYASDERRLQNSNQPMSIGEANHTFNLHIADIAADGTLSAPRQFQYYTTTSALSPTPLRNGIAFSYQASTADARNWHIQGMSSAGRWYPILGYGTNPELFHLGGLCVKTTGSSPGDYFVATRYYNFNNEGFGALWAQNLAQAGLNTYDVSTSWGIVPRQVGSYRVTNGVTSNDYPSAKVGNQYIGKMTTPRCGRPDELFMAYSPTSANGRLPDNEGNKSIYHSLIAYRPNLDPFHPLDPVNTTTNTGLRIIADDSSDQYTLVWPVPVLPWDERTGDAQQRFTRSIIDPATTIQPGLPYAQVGTSALYNTDRKPFDCWLGPGGQTPYSPNKAYTNVNQENDLIVHNTDGLTFVQNQSNFCEPLSATNVLGVAINLTSNKTNLSAGFNPGYTTDGNAKKEAAKLLGVYDVRDQTDQSFLAKIPANAPFELHLLHRRYGFKLADVRSWHSLKPRETRNDCGGCHQHQPGQAIPFAGTVADGQAPLDMAGATSFLSYDSACNPVLRWSRRAAMAMPEWKADIWPRFDQHCGSCHNANQSTDPLALAALDYVDEASAYNKLRARNYANSISGALGSPALWAARGERTDGRRNDLTKYQPSYATGQWGFRFSAIHATNPGLCNQNDYTTAQWVYRFGQWIDNHMPRDTGAAYGWKHDWYHPSVDAALSSADCALTELRVGFWDDSGRMAELLVSINDAVIASHINYRNGSVLVPLAGVTPADTVQISLRDYADNRQIYAKSAADLLRECRRQPGVTPIPVGIRRQRSKTPRS